MLVSFNDDSGTHDGAKIVLLCGFLADGDDWVKIDDPWQAVLHKPEWPSIIKAFHTADCVAGDGKFRGWSYAQRLAMLGDLVNVIVSLPVMAIGAAVIVGDYNALSAADREPFEKDKSATPLEFVFHLQMQQIIHRGNELKHTDQIGVVFETCDRATENKFSDMYIDYRDGFYLGERLLSRPLFLDKKQPGLQAADILAYSTYQLVMENYFPRDAAPHFDVIPAFMRMLEGIVHDGGLYDAAAFEALLKRVRAKDPSLIGNKKKRSGV
jgi:uncharacterized protein DUF3800